MHFSFYISEAYFNGNATSSGKDKHFGYLVELLNQKPFHIWITDDGNWISDHRRTDPMINDIVCAAGTEIEWRKQLDEPDKAVPGYYVEGCDSKGCPVERHDFHPE